MARRTSRRQSRLPVAGPGERCRVLRRIGPDRQIDEKARSTPWSVHGARTAGRVPRRGHRSGRWSSISPRVGSKHGRGGRGLVGDGVVAMLGRSTDPRAPSLEADVEHLYKDRRAPTAPSHAAASGEARESDHRTRPRREREHDSREELIAALLSSHLIASSDLLRRSAPRGRLRERRRHQAKRATEESDGSWPVYRMPW